jgi:hypothetical protein
MTGPEAARAAMRFEILALTATSSGLRRTAGRFAAENVREAKRQIPADKGALAAVTATRLRGALLAELRREFPGEVGGADYDAILVEGGTSANGVIFDRPALEMLRRGFEGAALVVRRGPHGFNHRGPGVVPWPMATDAKSEAGFFHGLRITEHGGREVLAGRLHLFETSSDVRRLISGRHTAGEPCGLSIETPYPATTGEPPEASPRGLTPRSMLHFCPERGEAEEMPVVAFVDHPSAGGKILPPGSRIAEGRRDVLLHFDSKITGPSR